MPVRVYEEKRRLFISYIVQITSIKIKYVLYNMSVNTFFRYDVMIFFGRIKIPY